jgi:hypothetical protein
MTLRRNCPPASKSLADRSSGAAGGNFSGDAVGSGPDWTQIPTGTFVTDRLNDLGFSRFFEGRNSGPRGGGKGFLPSKHPILGLFETNFFPSLV